MAYNFKPINREQQYLLPPSLLEWIGDKDVGFVILDAVEQMDLSGFYEKYRADGCGNTAYHPAMLLSLLLYAYCLGERSSRKIENLCRRDAGFRVISADQQPDHTTICRFRSEFEAEIKGLFKQVLRLCKEAGLMRVGVVAIDGTKMASDASLAANRMLDTINNEVERIMQEAAEADEAENKLCGLDAPSDSVPDEFADSKSRLARLLAAKRRLEEKAAQEQELQKKKIKDREQQEAQRGTKKRGRKPKRPQEKVNKNRKANTTDPESRIMKTRSGHIQGYNAQAAVTEDQLIVAAELTQDENDRKQLVPMLKAARRELDEAGVEARIKVSITDAGYWDEEQILQAQSLAEEVLMPPVGARKEREIIKTQKAPRGRPPKDMSIKERMTRKLLTKKGKDFYKKRSQTVEPIFGYIKDGRGIRSFMRRGFKACESEWKLICMTGNLIKLWRAKTA